MELAGYLDPGEDTMAATPAPTNAEIVRLPEAMTRELAAFRKSQEELLRKVSR
jgi:hypothetical protein